MERAARLREGTELDLPGIVGIYNHYVATSPATFDTVPFRSEDRRPWLREHLDHPTHRLWVAVEPSGGVLGWATTSSFRPRPAYATTVESSVYLRPDRTRLGLGSRLYAALLGSLPPSEVTMIVAGMTLPNPSSWALHRRFGFQHVGTFTRVGRKFGRFWDVAWFERPLVPEPRDGVPFGAADPPGGAGERGATNPGAGPGASAGTARG